jgi:hypothetical protein
MRWAAAQGRARVRMTHRPRRQVAERAATSVAAVARLGPTPRPRTPRRAMRERLPCLGLPAGGPSSGPARCGRAGQGCGVCRA